MCTLPYRPYAYKILNLSHDSYIHSNSGEDLVNSWCQKNYSVLEIGPDRV